MERDTRISITITIVLALVAIIIALILSNKPNIVVIDKTSPEPPLLFTNYFCPRLEINKDNLLNFKIKNFGEMSANYEIEFISVNSTLKTGSFYDCKEYLEYCKTKDVYFLKKEWTEEYFVYIKPNLNESMEYSIWIIWEVNGTENKNSGGICRYHREDSYMIPY